VLSNIVTCSAGLWHDLFLQIASKAQGGFDVASLASFITTSQQNYHLASMLLVINPITGAVIDPQLRDSLTYGPYISRIPSCQAFNSRKNASSHIDVAQAIKPLNIDIRLADFDHESSVAMWLHGCQCGVGFQEAQR
jgi:hypothetical protein